MQATLADWIIAGATAATALFTLAMAWSMARQNERRVRMDVIPLPRGHMPGSKDPCYRIVVRNGLDQSIRLERITVRGGRATHIDTVKGDSKHASWPALDCPLHRLETVEPGAAAQFEVFVAYDWSALARALKRWDRRAVNWTGKRLWRLTRGRAGGSVRFWTGTRSRLTLAYEPSVMSSRKCIHTMIQQAPGIIEINSASTPSA